MADVTYSSVSSSSGGAASTSVTFSHTNAGDYLVVGAGERGTPSGCTYNGVPLTLGNTFGNGSANNGKQYYMIAPPVGTYNIVESHSSGYSTVEAISLTNASQTAPATAGSNTGNSTATSGTIASVVGGLVVDHAIHNQGSILTATGTGQTRRAHLEQANAVAASTTTGAASVTVSYSNVGANDWSIGMLAIAPVAAVVTARPDSRMYFM